MQLHGLAEVLSVHIELAFRLQELVFASHICVYAFSKETSRKALLPSISSLEKQQGSDVGTLTSDIVPPNSAFLPRQ